MCIPLTEETLTVDANVIKYYFCYKNSCSLPSGLKACKMPMFCTSVLEKHSIAINNFIKTEYEEVAGYELIKNWLAKRYQANLAIDVACKSLPSSIKKKLIIDYGFDCNANDARYIQTCLNTICKSLVTENMEHFNRPHHRKKRLPMRNFIKKEISILIYSIDEYCEGS